MSIVRVLVTRTGGFAGTTRSAEIDDPGRAQAIAELLPSGGRADPGPVRDGFVYTFTIVTRTEERVVEVPAGRLPEALRPVVRALVEPPAG